MSSRAKDSKGVVVYHRAGVHHVFIYDVDVRKLRSHHACDGLLWLEALGLSRAKAAYPHPVSVLAI